ncbi:MAG: choice-of-anchor B family protein [Actinobacteria bacterium]|nr:choice-of-anchor B family protein [Actinomycetota bacterium]
MLLRRILPPLAAVAAAVTVAATGTPAALDGKARAVDAGLLEVDLTAPDASSLAGVGAAATVPVPAPVPCTAGFAGPYPCSNVDLLSIVPLAELGGAAGNDSWGWTDPETGTEIAIMGTGTGTSFVDVTDPSAPAVLGQTPQAGGVTTETTGAIWRDIKVNDGHAYIVTERGGGMQVVDLTQLVGLSVDPTREIAPVATYTGANFNSAHNIVINEDSDRAYLVGRNRNGGLHIVDIADPANPTFLGVFDDDGYTHDAQCVLYEGPDTDYYQADEEGNVVLQREICFAFNEDTVTIVDVTDPLAPRQINRIGYDSARYTHQGWLTPGQDFLIFNDELDEEYAYDEQTVSNTTTYIVEVTDLDAPYTDADVKRYSHETLTIDHNLYIQDDLVFEANYNEGLRVLRYTEEGLRQGQLEEVAYFDVDPGLNVEAYGGAWNVYPFFESGTIVVSTIDEGLFLLKVNLPE